MNLLDDLQWLKLALPHSDRAKREHKRVGAGRDVEERNQDAFRGVNARDPVHLPRDNAADSTVPANMP